MTPSAGGAGNANWIPKDGIPEISQIELNTRKNVNLARLIMCKTIRISLTKQKQDLMTF